MRLRKRTNLGAQRGRSSRKPAAGGSPPIPWTRRPQGFGGPARRPAPGLPHTTCGDPARSPTSRAITADLNCRYNKQGGCISIINGVPGRRIKLRRSDETEADWSEPVRSIRTELAQRHSCLLRVDPTEWRDAPVLSQPNGVDGRIANYPRTASTPRATAGPTEDPEVDCARSPAGNGPAKVARTLQPPVATDAPLGGVRGDWKRPSGIARTRSAGANPPVGCRALSPKCDPRESPEIRQDGTRARGR